MPSPFALLVFVVACLAASPGAAVDARTCVRILGGELHVFGSRYFIPPAQVPSGEARVLHGAFCRRRVTVS